MEKRLLEIALVLTSDDTFDIEVYEPGTGERSCINCHDSGDWASVDNTRIVAMIRSRIREMRDELKCENDVEEMSAEKGETHES